MKPRRGMVAELCFAAEGFSGTAASASLRKLGSIMDHAPSGRLFEAISTLSDMSARAARTLEDGSQSLDHNDHAAARRIGEALAHMDGLAETAEGGAAAITSRKRSTR